MADAGCQGIPTEQGRCEADSFMEDEQRGNDRDDQAEGRRR
jgi:hypothetical protein